VSGLVMPGGDPGLLEQLAAQLGAAAAGTAKLGSSTRQVTTSILSGADWTGDAADAYTAFAGNLTQGVDAAEAPLSRIALAVRDYAGYLRTAQEKVATYASTVDMAQVSGNDSGYLSAADMTGQDAANAVDAWQAAGDRAAVEVSAAAGQLNDLFGAQGPVQSWLDRQPVPSDSFLGLPGLGDPVAPQILKTPPGEFGPLILKDPIDQLGPEILLTPPGEFGPLINTSSGEGGYQPAGDAGIFTREEIAQLVYQHIGEGDNPERPSLEEIEATLNYGVPVQLPGQNSVQLEYRGVRVIVNEGAPARSTAYYPGS
jgi:uncharacterized protein YukE